MRRLDVRKSAGVIMYIPRDLLSKHLIATRSAPRLTHRTGGRLAGLVTDRSSSSKHLGQAVSQSNMATTTQPQSTRTTMKVTAVGDAADNNDEEISALLGLKQKVMQVEVVFTAQTHSVELRDTGDMAELDRMQPAVYRATNCFLLCYSERDRATFEVIETKWYPEVSSICPGVPFLLVACSRPGDAAATRSVSVAEGQKLCTKIKAAGFVEFAGDGDVTELLREALKAVAGQAQVRPEAVKSTPGHVEESGVGGSGGVGCCSCFKRCFKSKDSSYSFQ